MVLDEIVTSLGENIYAFTLIVGLLALFGRLIISQYKRDLDDRLADTETKHNNDIELLKKDQAATNEKVSRHEDLFNKIFNNSLRGFRDMVYRNEVLNTTKEDTNEWH